MRNIFTAVLLISILGSGCSPISNIFGKKTPHERYAKKLDKTDLEETPAGREWLAASKAALDNPHEVELPYSHNGYFGADKPRALGLKFTAERGERLTFMLSKKTASPFPLYSDVFKQNGFATTLMYAADSANVQFSIDIDETGSYVLRLQPELFRTGEYRLAISVGPSLGYPVAGDRSKIGSYWGASRDGGKRRHEGIDIFAPKRTPVIAAADGVITGVKEGGLGGKVVWMKLLDKELYLYYAHLDRQLVRDGQQVKKGDTLGLVGNTGNARRTPSHLHFGIYTRSGPIDPITFVNPKWRTAPAAPNKNLAYFLRLAKSVKVGGEAGLLKASTLLIPVAVSSKSYIAELPDGKLVEVPLASAQSIPQPVKSIPSVSDQTTKNKKRKM